MCVKLASQIFLISVNVVLMVLSGIVLAFGIWVKVSSSTLQAFVGTVTGNSATASEAVQEGTNIANACGIFLIVAAAVVFAIAICGCVSAMCGWIWLLWVYKLVMIVLFLAFLVFGILAIVYRQQAVTTAQGYAINALNTTFDDNVTSGNPSSVVWYLIMQRLNCCGWDGGYEFAPSTPCSNNYTYLWSCEIDTACIPGTSTCTANANIPSACCKYANSSALFSGSATSAGIESNMCFKFPTKDNSYYFTGCNAQITDYLYGLMTALTVACFVGMALMLLCIIAAVSLVCALTRNPEYESVK